MKILKTERCAEQQDQQHREVFPHFLNRSMVLVALPSKSLSQRYHFESRYTPVTQSVPSETPVAPSASSPEQPFPVDTQRTGTLTQASAARARKGHTLSN